MTRLLLRKPQSESALLLSVVFNNNICSSFVLVLVFISPRGFNHFYFNPFISIQF